MRQASKRIPESAEKTVRDIRRATRRHHSAEEKIRNREHYRRHNREIDAAGLGRLGFVFGEYQSFPDIAVAVGRQQSNRRSQLCTARANFGPIRSPGYSRRPSGDSAAQRLVWRTHVPSRQPRAQHRGAGRGRGVRHGRESGPLERRQPIGSRVARARSDRCRYHAWIEALIRRHRPDDVILPAELEPAVSGWR
jgi:hypothetical protein